MKPRFVAWIVCLCLMSHPAVASKKPLEIKIEQGLVSLTSGRVSVVTILKNLADAANVEIYVTDTIPGASRKIHVNREPLPGLLEALLKGHSYAVIYSGAFEQRSGVFLYNGTDRFYRAEAPPVLDGLQRQQQERQPGRTAAGPGYSDPAAQGTDSTGTVHQKPGNLARAVNTAISSGPRPSSGTSRRSVSGGSAEKSGDPTLPGAELPVPAAGQPTNETSRNSPHQNGNDPATAPPDPRRLILEHRISQLEAEIASGDADQWYDHWVAKKDAKFITHPKEALAGYRQELENLDKR